jgi:hypothetical protein
MILRDDFINNNPPRRLMTSAILLLSTNEHKIFLLESSNSLAIRHRVGF